MTPDRIVSRSTAGARAPTGPLPITVVVLTYNEELNLPHCLDSVLGWVDDVCVVDSGSTDRTLDIARERGVRTFAHPFESHARQWAWAIENLPIPNSWVLGLDADQSVTPELRAEIIDWFRSGVPEEVSGFYAPRRQVFRGRWIRHGGYYPKYLLKLFRLERAFVDLDDLVDHHFHVSGETVRLDADLVERNRKEDDIEFWLEKHLRYAREHAREEFERRGSNRRGKVVPALAGSPDQRVAWMKRAWTRMPLYLRGFLYFLYRYVLRLGFLDGKEGFVFHFFQGFWYRVLVDIHLDRLLQDENVRRQQRIEEEGS